MQILRFRRDGRDGYGLLRGSEIVDASGVIGDRFPTLSAALTREGRDALARIPGHTPGLAIGDVEPLPFIPEGSKILAVGRNYGEHLKEGGRDAPERPMLFPRFPSSLVGHGEPLVRPSVSDKLDYEGELAVVIGASVRRAAQADALAVVAGYTCFNDGSVRDWQRHTTQLLPGKNFWHSGSIGPWMVTADEIADPARLTLATRVNGVEVQRTSTGAMIFGIPALIEYVSAFIDLQPGDIIATGTPSGVGLYRDPQLFLKAGDLIEVEISGIGTLRNPVVDE